MLIEVRFVDTATDEMMGGLITVDIPEVAPEDAPVVIMHGSTTYREHDGDVHAAFRRASDSPPPRMNLGRLPAADVVATILERFSAVFECDGRLWRPEPEPRYVITENKVAVVVSDTEDRTGWNSLAADQTEALHWLATRRNITVDTKPMAVLGVRPDHRDPVDIETMLEYRAAVQRLAEDAGNGIIDPAVVDQVSFLSRILT